jgi:hypothetical protein
MAYFNGITNPVYITPVEIRRVLGTLAASSAEDDILMWQAEMVSRRIDEYCNRKFFMYKQAFPVDWPGNNFTLWLPEDLHTLTTLTNGDGNVVPALNGTVKVIYLYPTNEYPKYKIQLGINSSYVFLFWGTPQQAITVDGLWGFPAVANTGQYYISTGATVQDTTQQSLTSTTLTTQTGLFQAGDTVIIGDEFEVVQSLSAGTPNDTLTVLRSGCGTTATTHLNGTAIYKMIYHPMIVNAAYRWLSYLYRQKDSGPMEQVGIAGFGQTVTPLECPVDVKMMLNQFIRGH